MEIKEIWKTIEEYPEYQVSNLGRIKSLWYGKEKLLKQEIGKCGYFLVRLYKEGKGKTYQVHRIVATHFLPNPNNLPQVNHKSEVKTDNCVSNLEWCDNRYNANYATRNERIGKAHQKPIVQIHKSGLIIGVYDSSRQVEKELNINNSSISKCCKGKRNFCGGFKWKYLDELKKVS